MKTHRYVLGELQANCYLLEKEGEALLIDPCDDANFLLEEVQRKRLHLIGMYATHGHFDHVMAVGEIQMSLGTSFYIHQKDQFLIARIIDTAEHFLGYKPIVFSPQTMSTLLPGPTHIGHFTFRVMATPGHTPGSVCYYFGDEQALFTGDTLFAGAVGRTDLSYSNKHDLRTSLHTLAALPDETNIYPGHGEETYIGDELSILH